MPLAVVIGMLGVCVGYLLNEKAKVNQVESAADIEKLRLEIMRSS